MRALLILVLALPILSCATPQYTLGRCAETDDCFTDINKQPDGSICVPTDADGICSCPVDTVPCCRNGEPGQCVDHCAPGDLCDVHEDCPQPPAAQCGRGFCHDGRCELEIHPGPLLAQKYGDCRRRECNAAGALLDLEDVGDYYDDVNDCTQDFCNGGVPINAPLANGITCPALGTGYCFEASCVECIASMPAATSCGAGLACDYLYCEPFAECGGGGCGGLCAPCPTGYACKTDGDCFSGNCVAGMCKLPSCSNGKMDGEESDIDCGSCQPCAPGKLCDVPGDCSSGVCAGGECQAPSCVDGTENGSETGIDCGGSCGPC